MRINQEKVETSKILKKLKLNKKVNFMIQPQSIPFPPQRIIVPQPPAQKHLELPADLIQKIQTRSNRKEQSRFPYKLWRLLAWAGQDKEKAALCGCGWTNEEEFFIHKKILAKVLNLKTNTLNVNLKTLGFVQSRQRNGDTTFWKNKGFTAVSCVQDMERIRNARCKPESLQNLDIRAVNLPLLEELQLYMLDEHQICLFKKNVITDWERLVGSKLIFAIALPDFMNALTDKLQNAAGSMVFNDLYAVQQLLAPRVPNVIDIFDFAVFLARFGPFNNVPVKIFQFQQILSEIRPDFFMYNAPSLTSYFSQTFHNCFRFQLPQIGEYHCYNLPHISSSSPFLVDEDGTTYSNWQMMLNANLFLTQRSL